MDMPVRRTREIVEHVIEIPEDGCIDAKTFDRSYSLIRDAMFNEGVDFNYDDCFKVKADLGEIIFYYEARK